MRTLLILALSLLTACASAPPQYTTYLLRADHHNDSRQLNVKANTYIGGLTIAAYIDQPGLVLAQGDGEIHKAKYHQWAEPLRDSVRNFISSSVSAELDFDVLPYKPAGKPAQRIDITINQLHGDASGNAVLLAYWSVTGPDGTASYQFSASAALQADGYGALVAAEKQLLQQLASAIADYFKR
jgi:uncharacterized lipoprotein YmbA